MVCMRGRRRRQQARGYTRGSSLVALEAGLEARGDAGPAIIGRERRLLGLAEARVTLRAKFTDTATLRHAEYHTVSIRGRPTHPTTNMQFFAVG